MVRKTVKDAFQDLEDAITTLKFSTLEALQPREIATTILKVGDEIEICTPHQNSLVWAKITKIEHGVAPDGKHYNTFIDVAGANGAPTTIRIRGKHA